MSHDISETKVVNLFTEEYDVYVGRPGNGQDGYFGNPFKKGKDGTREEVLELYGEYFKIRVAEDTDFKGKVHALRGKRLGCFCSPKPCHADFIVKYLQESKT